MLTKAERALGLPPGVGMVLVMVMALFLATVCVFLTMCSKQKRAEKEESLESLAHWLRRAGLEG